MSTFIAYSGTKTPYSTKGTFIADDMNEAIELVIPEEDLKMIDRTANWHPNSQSEVVIKLPHIHYYISQIE